MKILKFFARLLMTLLGIVAIFAMLGGGAVFAFGHFVVPIIETKKDEMLEQLSQEIIDSESLPSDTDINVIAKEFYYRITGVENDIVLEISATITVPDETPVTESYYIQIDLLSLIMGDPNIDEIDQAIWENEQKDNYNLVPEILLDSSKTKNLGITIAAISLGIFVGTIVFKKTLFKKH